MKKVEYKKSSHSKYLLRYHFVMATKYRHNILNGDISNDIKQIQKLLGDILKSKVSSSLTSPSLKTKQNRLKPILSEFYVHTNKDLEQYIMIYDIVRMKNLFKK